MIENELRKKIIKLINDLKEKKLFGDAIILTDFFNKTWKINIIKLEQAAKKLSERTRIRIFTRNDDGNVFTPENNLININF